VAVARGESKAVVNGVVSDGACLILIIFLAANNASIATMNPTKPSVRTFT